MLACGGATVEFASFMQRIAFALVAAAVLPLALFVIIYRERPAVTRFRSAELALLALLIAAGVGIRLAFEVIPNFAPVAAIALFAGYAFRSRLLAVAAPLGVMVLSDLVIGGYYPPIMVVVYASLAAPVLAGHWLRTNMEMSAGRSLAALIGSSLAASVMFFLTTNFACWFFLPGIYPQTLTGLIECYAFALPFFRYTLSGDLLFAVALFSGSFAWQSIWQRNRFTQPAEAIAR